MDAMMEYDNLRTKAGLFWHKCGLRGCTEVIEFDDEPFCFIHSSDSGSSLRGFSARNGLPIIKF